MKYETGNEAPNSVSAERATDDGAAVARTAVAVGRHVHTALAAGPHGGEKVLLLHGFPQFADSWTEQLTSLARAGYRALAVDQRGYARGARPHRVADYTVDRLVADALAFSQALGSGPFHLVGHDWGGLVAWAFATEHPELLASLTILSTPHPQAIAAALRSDPDQARRSAYVRRFRRPDGVAEADLLADGAAALRRAYGDSLPPGLVDSYVDRFSEPGALTAALNWYRALPKALTLPGGRIRVPTLYLWGDQDGALGRTAAEGTGAWIDARYRFEVLKGAGHWLPDGHADRVDPHLLTHLADHAAG
ncbi:alpha/beta fold hydrolase [Streptomyces erythrochromogenes]|uniref:alpha/beta fold hydrolase n=1 Tax=Streptomyces erythrochromogenes TaxID=285574 RepID=UPI0037F28316